jgi:Toastrack DUF4097
MKTRIDSLALVVLSVALICAFGLPALAVEGSFQRTLKVTGPVDLEITSGSGSIQVRTGGSGEVQVSGHIKGTSWFGSDVAERIHRIESNPPIVQNGNHIEIGRSDDRELFHNISINYEVVVPAQTELRSHTGSGNQTIQGIEGSLDASAGSGSLNISNIGSTVHADTGSGNIAVDHVKGNVRAKAGSGSIDATGVGGGFEAETGSGHVTLEQTAPGAVRVGTGSGGMDLRGVQGSLEAKAGSGSIHAEGDPTGAWTVHTGSGGVQLRLPSDARFDLDAHTSSGSVTVDHPVTVQGSLGRKEVRGRVRGGGVPVEVDTGSGNIVIQ